MLEISNVRVYDLKESVIACRNAMRTEIPEYTKGEWDESFKRACKLAKAGSCHDNFLTGIRVSFDLRYPGYISPELQRYHWIDIVTSSSKMHRLVRMDIDKSCNKYVSTITKSHLQTLISEYNEDPSYENFMEVISNCPMGLELFMRVSTNYRQLKTIYFQRKDHRLKEDWGEFCRFVERLPFSEHFITGKKE